LKNIDKKNKQKILLRISPKEKNNKAQWQRPVKKRKRKNSLKGNNNFR